MTEVREHYDQHLGPLYAWMTGPCETASLPSTRLFEESSLVATQSMGMSKCYRPQPQLSPRSP